MAASDPVVAEVTVAAPIDVVWEALRDSREIRHWFGWDYDGLDGEIDAIFLSDAVAVSEADRTLETEGGGGRFELEARGPDVTVVRVTRPAPEADAGINEGWITFLQQLRFLLERHRGEERRTVFLSRATPVAVDAPVGARYVAGELSGEVWFRSQHQLGVTVDAWNDGLLIVTGDQTLLSTFGLDDAAFAALRDRWASGAR